MLKFKPRRREILFFSAWLAVLSVVLIKTAGDRLIAGSRKLNEDIAAQEARLVKLTRLLTYADSINAGYSRIPRNETMKDSGSFIRGIENIARKAGVNLVSLKPMQVRGQEQQEAFALRVEIQDDMALIVRFFSMVNRELNGIGVDKVQIYVQDKDELPRAAFIITALAG
ncbi:MAG: hypothetical protein ACM3OC_02915 [Deltaproteobacteria bacterium]